MIAKPSVGNLWLKIEDLKQSYNITKSALCIVTGVIAYARYKIYGGKRNFPKWLRECISEQGVNALEMLNVCNNILNMEYKGKKFIKAIHIGDKVSARTVMEEYPTNTHLFIEHLTPESITISWLNTYNRAVSEQLYGVKIQADMESISMSMGDLLCAVLTVFYQQMKKSQIGAHDKQLLHESVAGILKI